jgi:hypothetical protein
LLFVHLESLWKSRGQLRAVSDYDEDSLLASVQLQKQRRDRFGGFMIEVSRRLAQPGGGPFFQ